MVVKEGKIPVGDTGKDLDTTIVVQTDGGDVHREAIVIASPTVLGARIEPEKFNVGLGIKYSLPTTGVELRSLVDLIGQLIEEQRLTNLHLSRLTGEELAIDDIKDY